MSSTSPPPIRAGSARHAHGLSPGGSGVELAPVSAARFWNASTERTTYGRPSAPAPIKRRASIRLGWKSWLCAITKTTPVSRSASPIRAASSSEVQSGFSQRIALPARAAPMIASVCRWCGKQMSTASTSGSASRASIPPWTRAPGRP